MAWLQDDGVGQAVRDPGAAADQLGQAVVHAHRCVLEAAAGQDRPGEHVGAGGEVGSASSTTRGSASTIREPPGQRDGLGLGRADTATTPPPRSAPDAFMPVSALTAAGMLERERGS